MRLLIKYPSGAAASFLFFFIINSFSFGPTLAQKVILHVQNKCPFPIWPATAPNTGHPVLAGGGFFLNSAEAYYIDAPWDWSGRFWARTACSFGPQNNTSKSLQLSACETGDCEGRLACNGLVGKPPVTLTEISLQQDKPHFYDVSLLNGYNIPISVTNKEMTPTCSIGGCSKSLTSNSCPLEFKVLDKDGQIVACKSACLALDSDSYCCRNEYGSPDKCKPNVFSKLFKEACPDYISFPFDSPSPVVKCGGNEFLITFCPSSLYSV